MTFTNAHLPVVVMATVMASLAACTERPAGATAKLDSEAIVDIKITANAATVDPIIADGKRVFSSCVGCHTISSNGVSSVGPNLWGIVGSNAGSKNDFNYSGALKNSAVVWTLESLDSYIRDPASFIPGGAMAFAGVTDDDDRKAVLEYMVATLGGIGSNTSMSTDQGENSATWE